MATTERKLREVRKRLGLSQGELAEAIGVTQGTISRWEAGSQSPDFHAVVKIAELANLDPSFFVSDPDHDFVHGWLPNCRIVGAIRHAVWVDAPRWEPAHHTEVKLPLPKSWSIYELEAFVVEDQSADPYFPKDSIVFIRSHDPSGISHGGYVVVCRKDEHDLYEVTLKEIYKNSRGATYLSSVSENPEFQSSLLLEDASGSAPVQGMERIKMSDIVGTVVASFRLEAQTGDN